MENKYNMPESKELSAQGKAHEDRWRVSYLLNFLGVECLPTAVYRMGSHFPRKVKVVMPTSNHQKLILKRLHLLKNFPQKNLYIRPSLSKSAREERWRNLRKERSPNYSVNSLEKDRTEAGRTQERGVSPLFGFQKQGPTTNK